MLSKSMRVRSESAMCRGINRLAISPSRIGQAGSERGGHSSPQEGCQPGGLGRSTNRGSSVLRLAGGKSHGWKNGERKGERKKDVYEWVPAGCVLGFRGRNAALEFRPTCSRAGSDCGHRGTGHGPL